MNSSAAAATVLKGDHIAFLGDSGNAESTAPHLHFEIRMPNARWYNAAAVNPKYSLDAAEAAKLRAKVPNSAFAPLANANAFATQQANDFLGGVPSIAWLASAVNDLEGGVVSLDGFVEKLLAERGAAAVTAPTIRLYLGYFLRIPDYRGLDYWIRQVRAGRPLDLASSQFAASSEFIRRYGELDNDGFLTQIYRNLFDRDPDPSGRDYWLRRLNGGAKRGWVMRQFCESSEYRARPPTRCGSSRCSPPWAAEHRGKTSTSGGGRPIETSPTASKPSSGTSAPAPSTPRASEPASCVGRCRHGHHRRP
jgi:hypothetical protein